jgi:hypothetical protein
MKRLMFVVGGMLALMSSSARADDLIEGAKLCTAQLPRYEREYGIPTHLLSAISTTETGRYHEGLKIRIPWPWTINANGKGYVFDTKKEAIAAVKRLRARGVESIDVGCMQVNIHHHADAFASLDQAFDPEANIAYAAGFLRGLYDEEGSWKKAAADYHSKTPWLGKKYVKEVYSSWYQIVEKLRAARLQVPDNSVAAMNELKGPVHKTSVKTQHAHERPPAQVAVYHPTRNDARASKQSNTAKNDIVVVKPEIKVADNSASAGQYTPEITVAPAQQVPLTLQGGVSPHAHLIQVNDESTSTPAASSHKGGPNFIFND